MAKSAIDVSKLSILEVHEKEQSITNPEINPKKKIDSSFEISLTPLYNLTDNIIKIELAISIKLEQDGKQYAGVGRFSYDFLYKYENLKDLMDPDGALNPEIFLTCSNISYSTLTGIIYSKSSNTCIDNILLPVVSGSELLAGIEPD